MISCPHCNQRIKMGQSHLTQSEKRRFSWSGDPHGSPNIIEAQCVKAAAQYYDVSDWTDQWDPELTIDENVQKFAELSTNGNGDKTMREMRGYND